MTFSRTETNGYQLSPISSPLVEDQDRFMKSCVSPTALHLRRNENHKNLDDMQSPKKKVKLEQTSDKFTNKTVSFNLDDGIDSKKIPKWVKLSQETKNRSVTNDIPHHFFGELSEEDEYIYKTSFKKQSQPLGSFGTIKILYNDFKGLAARQWLNDTIIDLFYSLMDY